MNPYEATEQAYKKGYQQGVKDFAEKLKDMFIKNHLYGEDVVRKRIDYIAKEMGVE